MMHGPINLRFTRSGSLLNRTIYNVYYTAGDCTSITKLNVKFCQVEGLGIVLVSKQFHFDIIKEQRKQTS